MRHPGAQSVVRSSAVSDQELITRQRGDKLTDFIQRDADGSRNLHLRRGPRDRVARIDERHLLAAIEPPLDVVNGEP